MLNFVRLDPIYGANMYTESEKSDIVRSSLFCVNRIKSYLTKSFGSCVQ